LRLVLAAFSTLFAAVMFLSARDDSSALFSYSFGGLCLIVTLACVLPGRGRLFFGSIVGVLLFVSGIAYLGLEILNGRLVEPFGEPSALMATAFVAFIGVPGLLYAVKTRFGFRRDV
jgi:hypothetical protein